MFDNPSIRVRFAPSPTGDVHIGSIWLAQFNWLFAKQHEGAFIVRVEDTDQKRLVPGSVERLYEALEWYGLTPDEGPNHGGNYGPYIQSQRLELYKKYAQKLVEQGHAYYCFCSAERLEQVRAQQTVMKQPPRYDKHCLAIDPAEAKHRVANGESAVIRLNVPLTGQCTFTDLIRHQVTFSYNQIDDSVLLKSDGFPTYHLAVVVDDHLMEISHVIRAEEWLPSTPKHLLLYERFGWTPPTFAHLPQILGQNKKKLSKRDNAASALGFRDAGYLPEALQNFLALMGWHPKGDEEILSRADILNQFKLEDINPSGAIFDQTKLDWMNGAYIRQLNIEELFKRAVSFWHRPAEQGSVDPQSVLAVVRDRLVTLSELDEAANYFFPSVWDEEARLFDRHVMIPKKGNQETVSQAVTHMREWLIAYRGAWQSVDLKATVIAAIAAAGLKNGDILWPVRVALSLRSASPDVFDMIATLGREEALRRLSYFG